MLLAKKMLTDLIAKKERELRSDGIIPNGATVACTVTADSEDGWLPDLSLHFYNTDPNAYANREKWYWDIGVSLTDIANILDTLHKGDEIPEKNPRMHWRFFEIDSGSQPHPNEFTEMGIITPEQCAQAVEHTSTYGGIIELYLWDGDDTEPVAGFVIDSGRPSTVCFIGQEVNELYDSFMNRFRIIGGPKWLEFFNWCLCTKSPYRYSAAQLNEMA